MVTREIAFKWLATRIKYQILNIEDSFYVRLTSELAGKIKYQKSIFWTGEKKTNEPSKRNNNVVECVYG